MSFTKKDQDKAKRRQKVTKLSGLTESLIAPALGKKSAYLRQLIAHWPEIAGDMSTWAKPANIHPARSADDQGTLSLSIHSGRGPQASAQKEEILERVNRYFGFTLVSHLKISQDLPFGDPNQMPSPAQTQPQLPVKSHSLQDALDKLGKAIRSKATK